MKVFIFFTVGFISLVFGLRSDDYGDRGANAANVAAAGIAACRNTNSNAPQSNTIPYLTATSYETSAMSVLGGVLNFYHNKQKENSFQQAIEELKMRFDELQNDMNNKFADLTPFVDMKQFKSDVIVPTDALWAEMLSYGQWTNNITEGKLLADCNAEMPFQVAVKLRTYVVGPNNIFAIQAKGKTDFQLAMSTKDSVMARIYQLTMVQAFCVGMQNGPNYNATASWPMAQIYSVYSNIVQRIVDWWTQQETAYFAKEVPSIVTAIVTDSDRYHYMNYANEIIRNLSSQYPWDHFAVVMSDHNCINVQDYASRPSTSGHAPFGAMKVVRTATIDVDVFVIRYWAGSQGPYSRESDYYNCMKNAYDSSAATWVQNIRCGQAYSILAKDMWCGGNAKFAPDVSLPLSYFFVNNVNYKGGYSSAVWPAQTRPTTIEHDFGFWERPISIQLMPLSN